MILDNVPRVPLWNIFFHMSINGESDSILVNHCQKLLVHAATLDDWASSPYASSIKIGSDYTLAELRRLWNLYAIFDEAPGKRPSSREKLQSVFDDSRKSVLQEYGTGLQLSSTRSLGPLMGEKSALVSYGEVFRRYWETGETYFHQDKKETPATLLNPTFCYSRAGEGFNVHYGTHPLIPFHLAPLFGNAHDAEITPKAAVVAAQDEFAGWCQSFRASSASSVATRPVVRVLLGDAVALALALQSGPGSHRMKIHAAQWSARALRLGPEYTDHQAPLRFDVIDTSNLCDHIGLLNILVSVTPLLSSVAPYAVLYTESLLTHRESPAMEFESKMFTDISIAALLLDLAPVDLVSGFATKSNAHEIMLMNMCSSPQYHQAITWKRPGGGDSFTPQTLPRIPTVFDPQQFASLLHQIYAYLFGEENPLQFFAENESNLKRAIRRISSVVPSRESFIVFLRFIRNRLQPSEEEWSNIMTVFLAGLLDSSTSPSPFDRLNHQETYAQLHRHGLFTLPDLIATPQPPQRSRLSRWSILPSLVRIFLVIPPSSIAILHRDDTRGTPPLQCMVRFTPDLVSEHIFQSVDAAFGSLVSRGTQAEPEVAFHEDYVHQPGSSTPLVVSFVVPTRLFTDVEDSRSIRVSLGIRSTPATVSTFGPLLGPLLFLFEANFEDADSVRVVPEVPVVYYSSLPTSTPPVASLSAADTLHHSTPEIGQHTHVHVELERGAQRVSALSARVLVENAVARQMFANGDTPSAFQVSPCTIQVALGNNVQRILFPLPIMGSKYKLRLARRSYYIDVSLHVKLLTMLPTR